MRGVDEVFAHGRIFASRTEHETKEYEYPFVFVFVWGVDIPLCVVYPRRP